MVNAVGSSSHITSFGFEQDQVALLDLRDKVDLFERTKGFNTQGGVQHRKQLEELYNEAVILEPTKAFREGQGFLILANLKRLYAMTHYPTFIQSRVLLLSAISSLIDQVRLDNYGSDKKIYPSLNEWASDKLAPANAQEANAIQERLMRITPENLVIWTQDKPKLQWMLATAYRWLGHSFQNLNPYNTVNAENNKLFEAVYGASRELLKVQDSPRSKDERIQLIYNSTLFLHMRVPGNTLETAWKEYEVNIIQANPENKVIEAMCYNLFSVQFTMAAETGKVPISKALEFSQKCLKCYQAQPEKINPFHFANAHMNNAALRIKMPLNMDSNEVLEISQYILIAQNHMLAARAQGNDHPYFVLWESHMALWLALNKSFEKAELIANQLLVKSAQLGCMLPTAKAVELVKKVQALKEANTSKI